MLRLQLRASLVLGALLLATMPVRGQTIATGFSSGYSVLFSNLAVPGVTSYAGLEFDYFGNDMYIGGVAGTNPRQIFSTTVSRNLSGHINGFAAGACFCDAPNNGAGLSFAPDFSLIASDSLNTAATQVVPGTVCGVASPSTPLPVGVPPTLGGLAWVGSHHGLASGTLKAISMSTNQWFDIAFSGPSAPYTFTGASAPITLGGATSNGFTYAPACSAPVFSGPVVLVCESASGTIAAYYLTASGDPIPSSRQVFASFPGVSALAIDPANGDLVATSGNTICVITGFPRPLARSCPCDWNNDGCLNSTDFFAFLIDLFAGNADINNDAVTNSADLFDFLVCFFGGC